MPFALAASSATGWITSQCTINGVVYLSDDAFEHEGFGCDEDPAEVGVTGICIDGVAYNYISDDFDNVAFVKKINSATDPEGVSWGHTAGVCTPPIQLVSSPIVHSGSRYAG